jgi:flagellar L-ring protein FlgH
VSARLAALAVVASLLVACGVPHIEAYKPKRRDYQVPASNPADESAASPGGLWHEGRPASMLFTDARALRTNDLVVVKIEEVADAKRRADTDLTRDSKSSAQLSAFFGLLEKLKVADKIKIAGDSSSSFKGEGSTARSENLTATVPCLVRKVLPNGNLFVEGHRVILVNNEEHHFYISGVVRPIDIDQQNSVKSSMVADAEIEFVGRGVLSDNQKQGWFSRLLGKIWPF